MINLIFDYDGTLHNTIEIYRPAFLKAVEILKRECILENKDYSNLNIEKWLGLSAQDMWNDFAPNLSFEEKNLGGSIIGNEMVRLIENGNARLYDGALEVLMDLKSKGFRLIFLSNCKNSYLDAHRKAFDLDNYFDDYYTAENYNFIPKYEIFEDIKNKLDGEFIVIGDRFTDIEIGVKHDLKSVGCLYGYGETYELLEASVCIENICGLIEVISGL